jgi:tRNA-specific 2-thiouridylase
MLSQLSQSELSRTIFPLGDLSKEEVRQMARDINLNVAGRKDSQDLCFVDRQDYHTFLQENLHDRNQAGEIRTRAGKILGQHQGLAFYTIGQRKGLPAYTQALYVIEKDPLTNTLIVGTTDELGKTSFYVADPNWISGTTTDFPLNCDVKIRYRAKLAPAQLTLTNNGNVLVELADPLRDITPGQAAVFYQDDLVLGGGTII